MPARRHRGQRRRTGRPKSAPTQGFDNGTSFENYALFIFNIGPRDELKNNVWTYVGSLISGGGDVMPYVSKTGKLTFTAQNGGDMPKITVTPSGTEISGPGKTRQLGAADVVIYVYDTASKKYAEK